MPYLVGYILACFVVVSGLSWALSSLYKRSSLVPKSRVEKRPPQIRSHALISFSVILPFSALAFLLLTLAAMKTAPAQGHEGHIAFILGSLFLPTFCFLLGYFYFKKVVGS